jgi:hypothetical protein
VKIYRILILCLISALLAACSAVQSGSDEFKSMAVDPAPDAGFIEHPERQSKHSDLPFQKVWIKPGSSLSSYRALAVAPVNTNYMMEMDWLHKMSSVNVLSDVKEDIEELAQYFRGQVIKNFREDPHHRFQVIEYLGQPVGPTVRLELALIEIDPSQPVLHALSWAGPPGTGTAAGVINQRRAAFEGRLRDLQTGEIIATFADRDMADAGPLDLTRLTWYGPAKGILDRWAEQFVQIANREPGEAVNDPVPFTLRPF